VTRTARWDAGPGLDRNVVAGAAAAGAVGWALAVWLARVTEFAERVEEEQYCGDPALRHPLQTHRVL
jgi:hypothetical protein